MAEFTGSDLSNLCVYLCEINFEIENLVNTTLHLTLPRYLFVFIVITLVLISRFRDISWAQALVTIPKTLSKLGELLTVDTYCVRGWNLIVTVRVLFLFALIGSILLVNSSCIEEEMSSKLRITYQNLGLGDRVTRKLHDLWNILNTRQPHILYVSETLIDQDALNKIEAAGYTVETMTLVTERIWAAVKDGVQYKRRADLELLDFPALWLEVGSGKKSYLICGLYREFTRLDQVQASRTVTSQRERFNRFLDKCQEAIHTDKEIHLIGDWNLNCQKWIQSDNGMPGWKFQSLVNDLYDKVINHGFVRTVDQITRIHNKVESILDFSLTNRPDKIGKVQLTGDTKSDHLTLTITRSRPDQVAPPFVEGRSWSKVDWRELKQIVMERHMHTLREICRIQDVNELAEEFVNWTEEVLRDKYPVKKTQFQQKFTPWMTKDLLALVREKNHLLKEYQKTRNPLLRQRWMKMKTSVSNKCRDAEHHYWERELADGIGSHEMWEKAYKFVGKKSPGAPSQVLVNGKMISDPQQVAEECIKALMGKVERIIGEIPRDNNDPLDYTRDYVASINHCTFEYPTCDITRGVGYREVKAAIKNLKTTFAAGIDNLNTKFLKMLKKPLLHVLTCICNRSFEQKVFPDMYKVARVTLLCKDTKEKFNPLKYRPVSILCAPSKILEKVVVTRLEEHMETNNFFPDEQHGYRPRRSTTTAVLSMQDEILRDLENNIDSCVIFCDLSNAFDTLPHQTIIDKLRIYGLTEGSLKWYESYLSDRLQFVGLSGAKSGMKKITRGVPQGSLNGSTLFSIVFGDVVIVKISDTVFLIIYADDLSIKMRLVGIKVIDELAINTQMAKVQSWMNSNKLVFNDSKTELLVISRRSQNIYKDLRLTMKGAVIAPKRSCRMLGLYLTHNMRMDWYIDQMPNNLVSFLNHRMYILSKLRTKCGDKQYKLLAFGLIFSKACYGIQLYQQCTELLKDKIRLILNKCCRLATGTRLIERRRTKELYAELGFLTFDSLAATHDLNLLFSIKDYGTPKSLANKITSECNERGGPMTRSRTGRMRIPMTRDNQGVYRQRREAFVSRSIRRWEEMVQKEGDLYQRLVAAEAEPKKKKRILKEHFLKLDSK